MGHRYTGEWHVLAFQQPPEFAGASTIDFVQQALSARTGIPRGMAELASPSSPGSTASAWTTHS
ncbi:MAG: hypothetical protein R2706_19190 [Acidimicrobiales bacterium]